MGIIEDHHPTCAADSDRGGVRESVMTCTIDIIEHDRHDCARGLRGVRSPRTERLSASRLGTRRVRVHHRQPTDGPADVREYARERARRWDLQWLALPAALRTRACLLREAVGARACRLRTRACPCASVSVRERVFSRPPEEGEVSHPISGIGLGVMPVWPHTPRRSVLTSSRWTDPNPSSSAAGATLHHVESEVVIPAAWRTPALPTSAL